MQPHDLSEMDEEEGLSLKHVVAVIRDRQRIIWACLALCLVIVSAIILLPPPQYTITAVVYPAQSSQSKGLASTLASVAAPLAGLFGSSSSSDVQPFDVYSELIVSPRLAQRVINSDPDALHKIFYKEWDPVKKSWHPPHDALSTIVRFFNFIFGLPTYAPPSAARLANWLTNNVTITPINGTSIQQLSFYTPYPQFGMKFLQEVNSNADAIIREEATKLTDIQISYLEKKLDETQSADYRATLLGLLSNQQATRMSINKDVPYASTVLQSSFGSDLPTWPNPIVLVAVAIFAGLVLGVFVAITAALVWPEGAEYRVPSHNRAINVYRGAVRYVFAAHPKVASPAE